MKTDASIQHLKALMLLGVVVNHAWAANQYISTPQLPPAYVVSWFSNILIISGLPVFFLISGYFAGVHIDDILTRDGYVSFLLKKIRSLLLPYLSWNLLFILFYLVMGFVFPRLAQRVEQKQLTSICGFFTSWLGWGTRPIDAPLWFIRDLFIIFFCYPVIAWTVKRCLWIWLIPLMILLISQPARACLGEWQWYSVFCVTAGSWMGYRKFNLHRFERFRFIAPVIWFSFSIVHFYLWQKSGSYHPDIHLSIVFSVMSILAWLSILRWVDFDQKSFFARHLTDASFFIYCSHFLVCSCCLHVLAGRIPDSPFKLLILYGIFIGIGVPLILVWFRLGKRLMPRMTAVLSGGRLT